MPNRVVAAHEAMNFHLLEDQLHILLRKVCYIETFACIYSFGVVDGRPNNVIILHRRLGCRQHIRRQLCLYNSAELPLTDQLIIVDYISVDFANARLLVLGHLETCNALLMAAFGLRSLHHCF